jgi:hypothetical protein
MTDVQEQTSTYADDIDTIEDRKQRSREMIPVLPGVGLNPGNYAAYVTVAQGMCKPDNILLKEGLRNNIAVVIGLLDIAARAKLSPYLLAMKVYVQKGVLCMESQAFHALARPFLDGGLKGEYVGEGDDRVLIVRGRIKGDPYEYEHRSPPLGKLHPGHIVKEVNGERVQFCKGSPLWDRKPDVQLWYDTTRDWVRLHCPEAVLGVYTTEEVEDPEFRDVTPRPTLGERLATSPRPELREGFRPQGVESSLQEAAVAEHVERELAAAPIEPPAEEPAPVERPKRKRKPRTRAGKAAGASAKPKGGRQAPATKTRPKPAPPPGKGKDAQPSPEAVAYVAQADAWITAATDPDAASERWDSEYDLRNAAMVSISDRNRLRAMLEEKCEQLRGTNPP